jgi:hypothetical protein
MDDIENSSWSSWFQSTLGGVVSKAADAQYVRPYDIQTLKLQSLGSNGYYTEGQVGTVKATGSMNTTTMLMLGGALLLAVVLLKD